MGSGKSTIGKMLADKLYLPFIDLDRYIESKEEMGIANLFETKGEIYFRKIENKYVKELLTKKEGFVLALGGGTPCYANNMDVIKNSSTISIYLEGTIATLYDRLRKNKSSRPLIAEISETNLKEFIAKHLFERRDAYEKANLKISIDQKNKAQLVDEIWLNLQ